MNLLSPCTTCLPVPHHIPLILCSAAAAAAAAINEAQKFKPPNQLFSNTNIPVSIPRCYHCSSCHAAPLYKSLPFDFLQ